MCQQLNFEGWQQLLVNRWSNWWYGWVHHKAQVACRPVFSAAVWNSVRYICINNDRRCNYFKSMCSISNGIVFELLPMARYFASINSKTNTLHTKIIAAKKIKPNESKSQNKEVFVWGGLRPLFAFSCCLWNFNWEKKKRRKKNVVGTFFHWNIYLVYR